MGRQFAGIRFKREKNMPREKIDKASLEIIRQLQDGRKSFKEIGLAVGLSEATVRTKTNKMLEEGLIEIKAMLSARDMEAGYQSAYIGVSLKSPALKKTAEEMAKLPGVVSVALVTGRFDLMLTIMLTPEFELIDFFNAMLEDFSECISGNETFMIYEGVNIKMPYPY